MAGPTRPRPPTSTTGVTSIALRAVGCTAILATTAVGSLREDIGRGDLVILDQFIDFHPGIGPRPSTSALSPTIPRTRPWPSRLPRRRDACIKACRQFGYRHHERGTVVTIEGPRFSTRAESNMFRAWGADVINMSVATECALAVEAGVPYAAVAMSTDYDCWKTDEAPVSWEEIVKIFKENAEKVTNVLIEVIKSL